MKTKLALAALAIALATAPAKAAQCIPKSITARVLKSMNPNDLHRQFSGESRVGLSSTFIQKARIVDDLDVTYLKGDYVSPSGGFTKSVFVLLAEWDLFLLRASHARINCSPDDNVAQGVGEPIPTSASVQTRPSTSGGAAVVPVQFVAAPGRRASPSTAIANAYMLFAITVCGSWKMRFNDARASMLEASA